MSTRTVTPPSCGCGPSTACGWPCSPRTSRSSSWRSTGLTVVVTVHRSLVIDLGRWRPAGWPPSRAVAGLVDGFVDRLVGVVGAQQGLLVDRVSCVAGVASRKASRLRSAHSAARYWRCSSPTWSCSDDGPLDDPRRVVERAQHPGDVAPAGVGQLPLGQRLGRLALEVDDLPALDGAQGLAEVQVAVDLLDGDVADPARRGRTSSRSRVGVLRQLGHDVERRRRAARCIAVDQLGHLRRRAQRCRSGSARRRVAWVSAQRDAEPGGLAGEVAAHLVGVQVGLGEQVADAGQGEVPAVAGRAQELLEHRQVQWPPRRRRSRVPSPRASRRARRRGRSRPGSAPRGRRCRGCVPGVILRNTFSSESSPNATEELDCSPVNSVECVVEVELVAREPVEARARPSAAGCVERARASSAMASRSCDGVVHVDWCRSPSSSQHPDQGVARGGSCGSA